MDELKMQQVYMHVEADLYALLLNLKPCCMKEKKNLIGRVVNGQF